jgi:16S rRNA (cytosine967-C5)-methyltransferase
MRVPAYAAVSATVSEAPPRARSLLNAVLRRVAALVEAGPLVWPDLGTRLSYPDWVIRRLGEDLGPERAMGALDQMNVAASQTVRADGYTQDAGSQAVAEHMADLLSAHPGAVLDICAAPGGKATLLAGSSPFVVGADVAPARAKQVADNAGRLGLRNLPVVVADGVDPPFRAGQFAGVLVDAPCSGLGALRRRPDARWRVRPEDVGRLAALQRRLLGSAERLVAPGGVLVYSVCTLTRAETVDVDSWLAEELGSGWEVLGAPAPPWEPHGRGALLLPQAAGTDGMYLSAYRRQAA